MDLYVKNVGARQNTNIGFLIVIVQHRDVPQKRNIGHGPDAFFYPFFNIIFDRMTTQYDQNLAVIQQAAVHRIKRIRYQVVIERIIEQYALSVHEIIRGKEIVVIKPEAVF